MKDDPALVDAATLNFIGSYRKLTQCAPGGAVWERGGLFAFATGVPISLFNGIAIVGDTMAADVRSAVAWIKGRDVPYAVSIEGQRGPQLDSVLVEQGLRRTGELLPAMVLHPAPAPPRPPAGITVDRVDEADPDAFVRAIVEGGLPPDLADRLFGRSFASDPDVRLFVARLDGRPVGTSIAIRTSDVVGVYAVGTVKEARRRGVGTASTWAAVAAGRDWGSDTIVLQSSEMGFRAYSAMGFRTVLNYSVYAPSGRVRPPGRPLPG